MIFLKLGGSLITDKTGVEAARMAVLDRVALEIHQARREQPDLQLLLGHGGGSFGHVPAAAHGTRQGVATADQWRGFAEVHAAMTRLNRLVVERLLAVEVPAIGMQPSASAVCADGRISTLAVSPIRAALDAGLVPVVYGDVAFDTGRGGTIISTEEIMTYLAAELRPSWLLLAGETAGVYDEAQEVIPVITPDNLAQVAAALGDSRGTDVTGGMASKVRTMVDLVQHAPALNIRVFSGLAEGILVKLLTKPESAVGTLICR